MSDNAVKRPKPACTCADQDEAKRLTDLFEERFQTFSEHPEQRPSVPGGPEEFAAMVILSVRKMGSPCGPVYDSNGHFVAFYGIRIKPEAMGSFPL